MKKIKKIIAIILTLLCVCGFAACVPDAQGGGEESEEIANPIADVDSLAEIVDVLGGDIYLSLPEGASQQAYSVIGDEIGQVGFALEGNSYLLRVKKTGALEDISGMYIDFATTKQMAFGDYSYEIRYNEGAEGVSAWYDQLSSVSYSVYMESGATEQALEAISAAIIPAD